MAAGGSINVEELQKRLQCAICLDTVYNPKRLVCNHSFCKECLDKALKFNEDGSAILKCPKKCEARTRITRQQTTNNLQVDYMLKDILEVTCQTSEGETKTRCNACTRDVTKYCVRCQLFLCDHCEDPHSADEESFVCVEYHRARKEVMIVCSEHSTEASYVCREGEYACDNDFVCIYCIHRDHKVHTFEPYSQVEEKLKTSMKEKIISNGDHENRKAKVLENVANVKQHFEKAVRTNKLKCINEYIEYLNKEEEKLRDEFNTKTGNYINAFDSIAYFEECLSKDGMSFMLQRNEIVRRLYDHDDGDNLTIPDIKFTLGNTNFKDEHPLGSINVVHRKHLPSNISPGVQFQSANYLWKSYIFSLKHYVGQFTEELNSGGGPSWYTKILAETEELNEIDEQNIRGEGVVNLPIHNVSKVRDVVFSESVMIMNLPWRVKFVPMRGVGCRTGKRFLKSAGIFLQCDPKDDWHSWSCQAQALITIKQNSNSTGADLTRTVSHIFSAEVTEWGYGSFIAWRDLKNFTNADTLTIEVAVQVGEPQGVFVGSRKFTGFVGLKSQGGVGYMNSFLQMLFFTNLLRKAVYNTPTDYDDDASVMLALQRVFYELQFRNTVPASVTGKLTKLLQPEGNQEFFLHNHGFGRLCRKVTPSKALLDLLCGHAQQHIECTNVEYSSTSQEPASAMQKLTVKGKSGVLESLDEFINGIMLTGDKKYDAGEHGLQEAKQTYRFTKIPPLLHLNLLRFQYDATTHSHYKINDR